MATCICVVNYRWLVVLLLRGRRYCLRMKQDFIGRQFGRLTIMQEVEPHTTPCGTVRRRFAARCQCGTTKIVKANDLISGHTASCGCYRRDKMRDLYTTHGVTKNKVVPPEYRIWADMINRCENKNNKRYADYGGRGIKVFEGWRSDYMAFLSHMGPRPSRKHSIDRIDNDGHYAPGNVRWATDDEQRTNQRRSRFLTVDGKRQTISQWAKEIGVRPTLISRRLGLGWTGEAAVKTARRHLITKPPLPPLSE